VFILIFGAVNNSTLQLAIDSSVSAAEEEKLLLVADVQRFDKTSDLNPACGKRTPSSGSR
jgi:hypothetical protein